jgi:hypothetical protein
MAKKKTYTPTPAVTPKPLKKATKKAMPKKAC